jgi:hypothetical protein
MVEKSRDSKRVGPYPGETLVDVECHHVGAADLLALLVHGDEGAGRGVPHLLCDLEAPLRPARGVLGLVRRVSLQVLHGLALQPARVAEVVPVVAAHRRSRVGRGGGGEAVAGPEGGLVGRGRHGGGPRRALVGRGRYGGGPRRALLRLDVVVGVEGVGGRLLLGREERRPLGGHLRRRRGGEEIEGGLQKFHPSDRRNQLPRNELANDGCLDRIETVRTWRNEDRDPRLEQSREREYRGWASRRRRQYNRGAGGREQVVVVDARARGSSRSRARWRPGVDNCSPLAQLGRVRPSPAPARATRFRADFFFNRTV